MARITNANVLRNFWVTSALLPSSSFLFVNYLQRLLEQHLKAEEAVVKGVGAISLHFVKNCLLINIELFDLTLLSTSSNPVKVDSLLLLLSARVASSKLFLTLRTSVVLLYSIKPVREINAAGVVNYFKLRVSQKAMPLEIIAVLHKLFASVVGLVGYRIEITGRYARQQRASKLILKKGSISLSTLSSPIAFSSDFLLLKHGKCGLKIWLNKSFTFGKNTLLYSVVL